MIAVRYVVVFILILSSCNALHAEEPVARDTWKLQFVGNTYYSADGIRTGLALDRPTMAAAADEHLPMDQYLDLLRRRIVRGYQSSGFRDVQVSVNPDLTTGVITSNISEGHQWKKGAVSVVGLSERESESVALLIGKKSDHSNPLQEKQPKLKYWDLGSVVSFVEAAQDSYAPTVQAALTAIGYPQAVFTIALPEVSEGEEHAVNLQITVTDTGIALTVGEIIFTGLEKHSREQLIEFLEVKSGMPLTLPLREEIVSKLLDSGRFLMAEVSHEPFYFDPSEPLDLTIHVREYGGIAPLGEEVTDVQQALIKLSEWLSHWEDGNEDLHVRFNGPTAQVDAIVQSIVPAELQPFCNPALGTGVPGSFCIDAVTSPKDGSVFTFQIVDPQGNVSMRRTLLLAKSTQGLIAWQSRKKWLHTDQLTLMCKLSLHGLWPNEHGNDCGMSFGYSFNSGPSRGLQSEFKSTPAAVMHSFDDLVQSVAVEDGLRKLSLPHGCLELDHEKGTLRKLFGASERTTLEVTSGAGLVAAELSRLQEETKDWPNQFQPGREWPALVSMVLDDVKAAELNNSDALVLGLDLLGNEAALKRLSTGLEQLEERRTLHIPQENMPHPAQLGGFLGYMPILVSFVPAGSFPHRVGLVMSEYQSTGNSDLAAQLFQKLLETDEQGAIYCELMARLKPNSVFAAQCAKAGLERLSTDAFQRDMSPFVSEPGYVREVICSLLVWLQQTSDDDAEKIAKLAETNLKNQDGEPVNIRPLLILIRSQRDKPSEVVLASLLPFVWEGGLRAWVEADLKSISATAPTKSRKYFGQTPQEILDEVNSKTAKKDNSKDKVPVKPASNPLSVKDISLDEEWDLDD